MEPQRPHPEPARGPEHGRLSARPAGAAADTGPTGPQPVDPDGTAAAYVPAASGPRRLVVVLHGAGQRPADALALLRGAAEDGLMILL